jgi:type III secretion protein J
MTRIYRLFATLLVAFLCACGNELPLQTGLLDPDANEILTLLKRNGIAVTKTRAKDGVTLLVREEQMARAGELMRSAGLPKRALSNLGQMFKKEGMISTPLEERARYLHGLSQELEYTLSQIDGVITARVHIVLPERVAPGEPVQPSSASVFIKHQQPFDEDLVIPRVRRMVSNSIPGLGDEAGARKLSVVLMPANTVAQAGMEWEQVGPFMMEISSANSLRIWAFSLIGLLVLLTGGFGYFLTRLLLEKKAKLKIRVFSKPDPNQTQEGSEIDVAAKPNLASA